MICRRCLVVGRVQGVWFRGSTQARARELGVSGHALNLPDGNVEVLACGPSDAVDTLCDWLWQGPESAQVADVSCEDVGFSGQTGFVTG